MATLTISAAMLKKADDFLTQYLKDKVPQADFGKGSVMRDFVIQAVAHAFAFMEEERTSIRQQQSLKGLQALADQGVDVSEQIDAKLSDWFLTRRDGTVSRLATLLHFSAASTCTLYPTTNFYRTSSQLFRPDITSPVVYTSTDMTPVVDGAGVIVEYTLEVQLKAVSTGALGNVEPGRFTAVDQFSPYFLYAENLSQGQDGLDIESDAALLARAPTAITVRNLVNNRSIDTVLLEEFAALLRTTTIGFGDVEMQRDRVTESVVGIDMHVGGYIDIFLGLPRKTITAVFTVGASYVRPDNVICYLRDATVVGGFITAGVEAGHVLRVTAGLTNVPRDFIITEVSADTVTVSSRSAFPTATDEAGTLVTYSIGSLGPGFDDILATRATGETSRTVTPVDSLALPAGPLYKVKKVELLTLGGAVEAEIGPRVNAVPAVGEYTVFMLQPELAQSAQLAPLLYFGAYSGRDMRVTYETLTDYAAIQAFVTDKIERVVCANTLAKGYHPIYVTLSIEVRRKSTAVALDTVAVVKSLADFINNFNWTETLDISAITEFLRVTWPDIAAIFPFTPVYHLYAPDGQIYSFVTKDVFSISPSRTGNRAQLYNGLELRQPINNALMDPDDPANDVLLDAANQTLYDQLYAMGLSDRLVRYFANVEDVSVIERA